MACQVEACAASEGWCSWAGTGRACEPVNNNDQSAVALRAMADIRFSNAYCARKENLMVELGGIEPFIAFQAMNIKKTGGSNQPTEQTGGAGRDRTAGLVIANDALSQLSYSPKLHRPRNEDPGPSLSHPISQRDIGIIMSGTTSCSRLRPPLSNVHRTFSFRFAEMRLTPTELQPL